MKGEKHLPGVPVRCLKTVVAVPQRGRPLGNTPIMAFPTTLLQARGTPGPLKVSTKRVSIIEHSRDWVPVPETNVGAAFIASHKLVPKRKELWLGGDTSPLDDSVLR